MIRIFIHAQHGATIGDNLLIEYLAKWLKQNFDCQVQYDQGLVNASTVGSCDRLIFGPCGLVYDAGPKTEKDKWEDYTHEKCEVLHAAKKLGKRIFGFNLGVQQLENPEYQRLWSEGLNCCEQITTREEHTTDKFKMIGVSAPIETCRDIGFCMSTFDNIKHQQSSKPILAINLKEYTPEWVTALRALEHVVDVKMMPFTCDETDELKKFGYSVPDWVGYTLDNINQAYSELSAIVTSHMHASIFAIMSDVPFLQLKYEDTKHSWLMDELDYRHLWHSDDCQALLVERVKVILAYAQDIKKQLAEIRLRMKPLALKNFEILKAWLEN